MVDMTCRKSPGHFGFLAFLVLGLNVICIHTYKYSASYEGDTTVNEGDSFTIKCEMDSRQLPKWTINGTEILSENDAGYSLSRKQGRVFNLEMILHVESAQAHHEGEYRCNGLSRDFHFVEVITTEEEENKETTDLKKDDKETSSDQILKVNETIRLVCHSEKDVDASVSWYKRGALIVGGGDSNIEISGKYFTIERAQEDDAGEYICRAFFRTGRTGISRIFQIKSPAKIVDFPEKQSVIKGQSLALNCKVHGYPNPRITWFINNTEAAQLAKDDPRIWIFSEGVHKGANLNIRKMNDSDNGMYTCRVENFMDKGKSVERDEESVFVHVRVITSSDLPSTTYVQKGGKFTLACRVPLSGIHLWYKDGKPIVPNSLNRFHLEQDHPTKSDERFPATGFEYFMIMRLTVDQADAIHTGEYKCNSFGPHSQRVVVVTENMIETNEDEPGMGKLLTPGEQLILHCNTTKCPHCSVIWFKDQRQLFPVDDRIKIYENNSVVIDEASYNDTGVYVCAIDRKELDVDLNASISVQTEIKLEKFDTTSSVIIQGNRLELYCIAKGAPAPTIKWFKGADEINATDERIKLLDFEGLKNAKLFIEEVDFEDRDYYTCEAYNQVNTANTTIFIRIKDKLAALWPFLGICAEVAILCSIIFVYERRKSKSEFDEPDTDHPTENKSLQDQKPRGQDIRQRK